MGTPIKQENKLNGLLSMNFKIADLLFKNKLFLEFSDNPTENSSN